MKYNNIKKNVLLLGLMLFSINTSAQNSFGNTWVENTIGQKVLFSSLLKQDTPVILIFWGSTCSSCSAALEAINEKFLQWQDQYLFQVIAIATDDARSASKAKLKASANGWDFTIVFDKNQDLKRAINATGVPQFIIIDKARNIVYSHLGYTPGMEEIIFDEIKKKANHR